MNLNNKSILSFFNAFLLIFPFISIILSSCDSKEKQINIYGHIRNAQEQTAIIEQNSWQRKFDTIAWAKIDKHGYFQIQTDSIDKGFYRLKLNNENIIFLFLRNGDEIHIESEYPDISKHYKIKGSKDNELLRDLNLQLLKTSEKIKQYKEEYYRLSQKHILAKELDSLHLYYNSKTKDLYNSEREFLLEFIQQNHKSPVIYIALYQYFGTSPVFDISHDLDIFEYTLGELMKYNSDLNQIRILESDIYKANMIERQKILLSSKLKPGDKALDFSIKSSNGKSYSMESFKQEEIILCFWASWSDNSIKQTLKLSEKLNPEQKLVLISLDKDQKNLDLAINTHNFNQFTNLCDFKSWDSQICKDYNISKIPIFVQINKNGFISRVFPSALDYE